MKPEKVGMVGLGVMGANLLRNFVRRGFHGVGYDAHEPAAQRLRAQAEQGNLETVSTLEELIQALPAPRKVFVMVPAGPPVEEVLTRLDALLQPGDVVVECGNSYYQDTNRRAASFRKGAHLVGCGVSGGEQGALEGPSMMPGGPREACESVLPILRSAAAQLGDDGPCVAYMGPEGAGHYVKMVHNGIEYGDMQLIAEAYHLLERVGHLSANALAETFTRWNAGPLRSFLIEITARTMRQVDAESGRPLVELIKDSASMKGTGKWTVQDALERGVAIPTITAAVDARLISANWAERQEAAAVLSGPVSRNNGADRERWSAQVESALYCAKVCSYAQGMALLQQASTDFRWSLPLAEIARIWRDGCIIRAQLLETIQQIFQDNPQGSNLLLSETFSAEIAARQEDWRDVVATGTRWGLSLPAMSASLSYYDALRTRRLPANLVQAQRDLFGAHTYERLDRSGHFHTTWD